MSSMLLASVFLGISVACISVACISVLLASVLLASVLLAPVLFAFSAASFFSHACSSDQSWYVLQVAMTQAQSGKDWAMSTLIALVSCLFGSLPMILVNNCAYLSSDVVQANNILSSLAHSCIALLHRIWLAMGQ